MRALSFCLKNACTVLNFHFNTTFPVSHNYGSSCPHPCLFPGIFLFTFWFAFWLICSIVSCWIFRCLSYFFNSICIWYLFSVYLGLKRLHVCFYPLDFMKVSFVAQHGSRTFYFGECSICIEEVSLYMTSYIYLLASLSSISYIKINISLLNFNLVDLSRADKVLLKSPTPSIVLLSIS